jgi:hypothetical protein
MEQLHPVHARHLDVQHREIDRLGGQAVQRAFAIGEGAHRIAFLFQRHRHAGEDVAIVVDQGDGLLGGGIAGRAVTRDFPWGHTHGRAPICLYDDLTHELWHFADGE